MALAMSKPLYIPDFGDSATSKSGPLRSVYDAALETQAQDYDNIMGGYDDLINRSRSNSTAINPQTLSPVAQQALPRYQYQRNPDLAGTISGFKNFADTGGFSGGDLSNIRARAVSPLRSVYASAKRELDRRKNIQGGYSPNYGAILAKLAREQGEALTNANIGIESGIAQMIQSGKLSGLQGMSPLVSGENQLVNQIGQNNLNYERSVADANTTDQRNVRDANATMKMRADEINANNKQQDLGTELSALSGKTNLYGTTPALTNTFANQVLQNNQQNMQAVQTANQIKNARAGIGLDILGAAQNAKPKVSGGMRG